MVSIESERQGEDEFALIRVRDNGAGIAEEDLPNIFEMYYQGKKRMHMSSGLGIGLLLVDKIVQLHGGAIEARSAGLGRGSEFIVRLPAITEHTDHREDLPADPLRIKGKSILVVDDNEAATNSLTKLLNKLGATAEPAYSGREALEKDMSGYDLILLDIGMPHMDGYELVKALRERGITKPIVALTGYGLTEDRERAIRSGFTSHLTKPVGIDDIARVIGEVLV